MRLTQPVDVLQALLDEERGATGLSPNVRRGFAPNSPDKRTFQTPAAY